MPDTKITALAAITTVAPANDLFPIVDVSDNSMAASGTTKNITVNQLLGAGGTATLASATITGDLTVDTSTLKVDSTNDRVGIKNASPTYTLDVTGTANDVAIGTRLAYGTVTEVYSAFRFNNTSFAGGNSEIRNIVNGSSTTGSSLAFFTTQQGGSTLTERYRLDTNGVATWSNVGGFAGTAMTLNATGLGVGEAASVSRLQARGSTTDSSAYILYGKASSGNVICFMRNDGRFLVGNGTTDNFIVTETGNVGVGGGPSYKLDVRSGATSITAAFASTATTAYTPSAYTGDKARLLLTGGNATGATIGLALSSGGSNENYFGVVQESGGSGAFVWQGYNGSAYGERMRLDSAGNLLMGTTSALASGSTFQNLGINRQVLTLKGDTAVSYTSGIWNASTTGDALFQYFATETSLTVRGGISYNRAGGLVAYNTTSDYRAKDIIGPVSNSGSVIDSLKVYIGKMKGASVERPMLVAHEAQTVAPYAVTGEKDEVDADGKDKYQQMDVSSFVPLLIAEIQSLRTRVQTLEAK